MSEVDECLWTGIEKGFFDQAAINDYAATMDESIRTREGRDSTSGPWRLYHDTFARNDKQFVAELVQSFRVNAKLISVNNADGAISILRDLGENEKASEVISLYLKARSDNAIFDSSNLLRPIQDEEFARAVANRITREADTRKPREVLSKIAKDRGWNPADEKLLGQLTPDDFYKIFKGLEGEMLTAVVKVPLEFGFNNEKIRANAVEALKRIAGESTLNRVRVSQKFGITLDGEPKSE